mgnify:CR=1 FL=1|tara:strand:+ start:199 stop:351 length:153 start_codon:yes stop_codon:yes gene_type:complete
MDKPINPLVKKHYPELAELIQEQRDAIRRLESTMHELDLLFGHFTEDKEL